MIEVYGIDRKRTSVLENAYNSIETKILNGVSNFQFTMPSTDDKTKFCSPRCFVRANHGELYRIIDYSSQQSDVGSMVYTCEHVIATLADRVLYKDHILSGYKTADVIRYILSKQQDWVLDTCDFEYYYDYAWTSENLLSALWSVATPFTEFYKWEFNTTGYPWRLSLRRIDLEQPPQFYVLDRMNLLQSNKTSKTSQVITRLYCQGYGEGVNQLGIESVNDGLPYIESPQSNIDRYGLIEAVWTDRRYEDSESLLEAGRAILNGLQSPTEEYQIQVADLHALYGSDITLAEEGRVILFQPDHYKTYITKIQRSLDQPGDMTLTLANKPTDLVDAIADLADRQRIEATYAQGATQLWGSPLQEDASPDAPLGYRLWIPDETKIMNKVMIHVELSRFRAYSKSTSSGGGSTQTSSSGGGTVKSTQTGGGSSVTSGASSVNTTMELDLTGAITSETAISVSDPPVIDLVHHAHNVLWRKMTHTHGMQHTHTVNVPSHDHSFSVPAHEHNVTIPSHTHNIEYGVFYASGTPSGALIRVNGKDAFRIGQSFEGDITDYLIGEDGKIPRGRFINIEVVPDGLAYVVISIAAQGFIQSKGSGQY